MAWIFGALLDLALDVTRIEQVKALGGGHAVDTLGLQASVAAGTAEELEEAQVMLPSGTAMARCSSGMKV